MLENYRRKKWRITRVPRFAAQMFAHRFVIVPAANKIRNSSAVSSRQLIARLRQAYRNWFMRVKELALRDLWIPASDFMTENNQKAAIKRCLYCVPTSLTYKRSAVLLCGHDNFCPFCYARYSEDIFRRFTRAVTQLRKTKSQLIVTCRIATYVIPAKNFAEIGWDKDNMMDNAVMLRKLLRQEIDNYKKIRRKLTRNTEGSAWRVVLNPADTGWEVQVRQLFISRPKAKRPTNRAKKGSVIFLQSAKLTDMAAAANVLGCFVEYPRGLLIGYAELVASLLHAKTGLRLNNATGCLYKRNTAKKIKEEPKILPDVP